MKHIGLAVMLIIALLGCSKIYAPPATPVCAAPEAAGSVLCAVAQRLNTSPEQLDSVFLDAALVGIGTKVISASELKAAVGKAQAWVEKQSTFSIDLLTKYLVKEATIDPALALLLSRRLGVINLPDLGVKPLTPYDVTLVKAGLQHQMDQLAWF